MPSERCSRASSSQRDLVSFTVMFSVVLVSNESSLVLQFEPILTFPIVSKWEMLWYLKGQSFLLQDVPIPHSDQLSNHRCTVIQLLNITLDLYGSVCGASPLRCVGRPSQDPQVASTASLVYPPNPLRSGLSCHPHVE